MTTAATVFVEAAIGMAAGGGLYAVAAYATGLVLFALICLAWAADRLDLKFHRVFFRITASSAENIAAEVQKLLATLKVAQQHFRVSMAGASSIIEFESEVSHGQREAIVTQLHREGVTTEITPLEGQRE